MLYDCHSIRSVIPRLFEGTLPVFNLGTNDGKSADPILQGQVAQIMAEINGRAELFGHQPGQVRAFDQVVEHVLSVAGPERQAAKQLDSSGARPWTLTSSTARSPCSTADASTSALAFS